MSAQHTPGPLVISLDENGYFVRFETFAKAYAAKRQHDTQPDLLKALEQAERRLSRLVTLGGGNDLDESARDDARAAIAKATGSTS